MWSSEKLACSMKNGLRFENNNYIFGKPRSSVKPNKKETIPGLCMYYLIPGLTAVVCFLNSLQGEFVHDDIPAILNNKDVRWGESSLQEIFTHDFWGRSMWDNTSHKSYRPLTVLTFRLNHMLGGYNPVGYHVTNVLLHASATVLLTRVCHKYVFGDAVYASLAGLLFATHPIHTEAVSGVVGRADVLCCVFFLLSFYAFQRCLCTGPGPPQTRRPVLLFASILLAVCATLSKEQGITVIGVCIICDLLHLHTSSTHRVAGSKHTLPASPVLRRCTLFTASAAVLLGLRLWVQGGELPQFTDQDNPAAFSQSPIVRLLTYSYLPVYNLWLLLAPVNLSYDWQMGSIPLVENCKDLRVALAIFVLVIFAVMVVKVLHVPKGTTQKSLAVGLLFLITPFLPASNAFFKVGFVIAERILYIPSMGYVVILTTGARHICDKTPALKRNVVAALLLICLLFTGKSVHRNSAWRDRESLFRSGLRSVPHNAKMHYNYANFLKDQGTFSLAESYYRNAIRLWPSYASAHNNLGTVVSEPAEAQWHYREALRLVPCHANAHFNLGSLLWKLNQADEAVASLEQAITCDRNSVSPFFTLASLYRSLGEEAAAESAYRQAIFRAPHDPRAYYNMADFLNTQGRHEEALHHVRRSLQLDENNPISLRLLGLLLARCGLPGEAHKAFTRALGVSMDPVTLDMAGVFMLNISQTRQAISYFTDACRLSPGTVGYRIHLAQALSKVGSHVKARDVLEEVIKTSRPKTEVLIILANIYGNLNEHLKATVVLEEALAFTKDNMTVAGIHLNLGKHYRDLKNMDVAFYHYLQAVGLNEELGEAHHNLGVFYHMYGDLTRARQHYLKALAIHPGNDVLKQNFAKLLRITQPDDKTKTKSVDSNPVTEKNKQTFAVHESKQGCNHSFQGLNMDAVTEAGLLSGTCATEYPRQGPDAFNQSDSRNSLRESIANHLAEGSNYADSLSIG